ncbi:hypothetical protein [Planctomycetes bacterium TBK1r]|uniref:hypothetical protein n=1 Tax=Stieleria magnilauensis TaxID=2527963 RepID=UPI0011A7E5E9
MKRTCSLLLLSTIACLAVRPADAAVVIQMDEVPSNGSIRLTGSGTINLTDLNFRFNGSVGRFVIPSNATVGFGGFAAGYSGVTAPGSFGADQLFGMSQSSGDAFMVTTDINLGGMLFVPTNYVSKAPLAFTGRIDLQNFSSMGVSNGDQFVWTWGSGENADSVTLKIGTTAIPEPDLSIAMLLSLVVLAMFRWRRTGSTVPLRAPVHIAR